MTVPTLAQGQQMLQEAANLNPGPWVDHSLHVAAAARALAEHHPDLDSEQAYIYGLIHDIGRCAGVLSRAIPTGWIRASSNLPASA